MSRKREEKYDITSVNGNVSLRAYKANALRAANELFYTDEIKKRIKNAKSITEIDIALKAGRDMM